MYLVDTGSQRATTVPGNDMEPNTPTHRARRRHGARTPLRGARPLPAVDEQRLGRTADGALLVVEGGVGQADAGRGGGRRLKGDPLAGRGAQEVDGQVGVDEAPAAEVEAGADPVAG